jgi:hypothetical protein
MITTVQDNLAKLMSTEDITVIQKPESSAYFDTKNRVLVIPTWKNLSDIIVESLIGHEIGHALYTNSESWISAIKLREPNEVFRDYLNVIEDARIESLVKQKYPGMKKIFYHGYKQILDNKIFEIDAVEDLPLIDRLNIHFKFSGIITLNLNETEISYISRIEKIDTFSEVVDIAIEIFDSEKHNIQKSSLQNLKNPSGSSVDDGDGEDTSGGSIGEGDEKDNQSSTSEDSSVSNGYTQSKKGSRSDSSQEMNDGDISENSSSSGSKGTRSTQQSAPSNSKTLRGFDESMSNMVDMSKRHTVYTDIPSPILSKIIYPFGLIKEYFDNHFQNIMLSDLTEDEKEDFEIEEIFGQKNSLSKFYKDHKTNIDLHKQLFQMRKKADQYNKTMTFRTGKLDTNKLYSYKYNDEIFKTFEVKPNGKNHGLIFIMDFSSSMFAYLRDAKSKALELILFCKQIGIPFVLYGFFDTFYDENFPVIFASEGKNECTFETNPAFRLLELLTSSMSESDFKRMVEIFMDSIGRSGRYSLGGTPLTETHLCLDSLVNKFRGENPVKIVNVVYFTDGQGSGGNHVIRKSDRRYNSNYMSSIVNVIHDPKTRKNYDFSKKNGVTCDDFLDIIKNRMKDVNVINFLITNRLFDSVPEDLRDKCLYDMGYSKSDFKKMSWVQQRNLFDEFDSKYIVLEVEGMGSFDTTFVCSTEMFKKQKSPFGKNIQSISQISESFGKSSNTKKRVNAMISKFIDLIV